MSMIPPFRGCKCDVSRTGERTSHSLHATDPYAINPCRLCGPQIYSFKKTRRGRVNGCALAILLILDAFYLSASRLARRAVSFESASASLLRSLVTTASGALLTKRSLESFFSTERLKPSR